MVENFINDYVAKLSGKIPDEYLITIRDTLQLELNDYELQKKETAIAKYTGIYPECFKVFLVTKKIEGKSIRTLDLYSMYIKDFFDTVNLPIEKVTSNSIKVYLYTVQQQRGISNCTLESRRSALSSFFSWAAAEQYIERNPMATIKPINYERAERKPLSDTELELIREACKDIREKAIIEFFYSTGCRVAELCNMNRNDVNFDTMEVKLFGKGSKHRKSYLTAKAAILLTQYLDSRHDDNEALFVHLKAPHSRMQINGIEVMLKDIGIRAGVDRLHPHLLRHTTATNALQRGMDITQVQQLLGHTRLDTTMIYAKVDTTDVQRNHKKCLA